MCVMEEMQKKARQKRQQWKDEESLLAAALLGRNFKGRQRKKQKS